MSILEEQWWSGQRSKIWLVPTGFPLPASDKSVKALCPFLSANFSISALSWKDKKYINL